MSARANLSPLYLVPRAWKTFLPSPWLTSGMWIVYELFTGGGLSRGTQSGSEELTPDGVISLVLLAALLMALSGPIRGGYDLAMLRLVRNDDSVTFTDLFSGFQKFRELLLTGVLYPLIALVGILLLIVPGIVALITLWPAFLLVMEDNLSPVDALKEAWLLTESYKLELFILALTTFLFLAVGLLTFGVGLLVAGPVTQFVWIGAYREMRESVSKA